MKVLIIGLALLAAFNTYSMECGKVKHRSYPQDEQAKIVADKLNVKTCDGKRFKETVAAVGLEITYVTASDELLASLQAEKEEARVKEQEAAKQALGL